MAIKTLGGCANIARTVTGDASQRLVRAGQGKLRLVVIKCRRRPCRVRVARETIVVEVAALVVRIIRLRKIAGMARKTLRRSVSISAGVTRLTFQTDVPAFKRKSGKRVIVTPWINRHPAGRRMTTYAIVTQSVCHMIWICRRSKRHLVTRIAVVDCVGVSRAVT